MADKIKSFFQKKVMNAKFVNAGKGHKLTDSASSAGPVRAREPITRAEPTQEAKTAGQAALARLEAKGNKITQFNTSYAAIQAQVRKELEQEKIAQQKAQNNAKLKQEVKVPAPDQSLLAVTGIYFRCPYLSNEILTQVEWKKRIREFLYEQLKGEEAGLTACLIIQNCNSGKERIENCVDTLGKYLENIINNPDIEKYRKIRMQNKIFQEKVLPIEGAVTFLNAVGFQQQKLLYNEVEEDFLIWSPENCDIDNVIMLSEAVKSAERIPLELDRNIQVLLPVQAQERNELPPSFFNLTPAELEREQKLRTEAVERSQMFMTKAMREEYEKERLRTYKFALIRIKFPDDIILQGTFSTDEQFQAVLDFIRENLVSGDRPFSLKQLGDEVSYEEFFDKTLRELALYPAVLLLFIWKNQAAGTSNTTGYLKEELLSFIQPV